MPEAVVHPPYVRITHWINAIAMLIMISSGCQIYNASPLFPFTFPSSVTLGGWLAGGLLWHFAVVWLLVANGRVYMIVGIATASSAASCFRSGRGRSSATSGPP